MQSVRDDVDERAAAFPVGAAVTVAELELDPHPVLARLREREPVSWLPALDAWYVTRRDLALRVVRDPAVFTVDDPRFSTARVVGRSMLSTDGAEHRRHRDPFARAFRLDAVRARFQELVEHEADRLVDGIADAGAGELRRSLAGPLAVLSMVHALGLGATDPAVVLGWYDAIVAAVTSITAGGEPGEAGAAATAELRRAVERAVADDPTSLVAVSGGGGSLAPEEVAANAAVLLFGGIETTEGMIANALLHLLSHPRALRLAVRDPTLLPRAVEESLRLEPAAAVVDRYATEAAELGGARIAAGDLVTVSIAAANRDPAVFPDPDCFDPERGNAHLHLAFAQGPHVCLGMHLARLEAQAALRSSLRHLPGLRLDPDRPSAVRGLVFRKPQELYALWEAR